MEKKTEEIYWLNDTSRKFLAKDYLLEGETPEQRIKDICKYAEAILGIPGFADELEEYVKRGYIAFSSPIWANYARERGLPISCFGSYISDTIESIAGHKLAETAVMTKNGGGTSAYWGDVRGRGAVISAGGTSTGSVHFMELYDKMMNVVSQGNVRRGSYATYLPIDHPDIEEFLKIKAEGNRIQDLSFGVCISDEWMESMKAGDKQKRKIWGQVIKKKFETGYPYLFFTDNVNNAAPQVYKDKGLKIHASNLCNEICLSSSPTESFVCDLSSLNLVHWDEMKNTRVIWCLVAFLDSVMTEFINKTEGMEFMQHARNFAINQRALGVGVLGYHSLLQSKMIPFESMEAKFLNNEIFTEIRKQCDVATQDLAKMFGEPPLLEGYGRRNVTTMALPPTTSSSAILGQPSPSIEPHRSNYFVKDLAKGKFTFKNPDLEKLLDSKGLNKPSVWKDILLHGGSVQFMPELTDHEKAVFKTFGEISQKEIIIQAAQRQPKIDQGQSLNVLIPPTAKPKEVSELYIFAHEQGVKGIYYQRSANPSQELARSILTCTSCE